MAKKALANLTAIKDRCLREQAALAAQHHRIPAVSNNLKPALSAKDRAPRPKTCVPGMVAQSRNTSETHLYNALERIHDTPAKKAEWEKTLAKMKPIKEQIDRERRPRQKPGRKRHQTTINLQLPHVSVPESPAAQQSTQSPDSPPNRNKSVS